MSQQLPWTSLVAYRLHHLVKSVRESSRNFTLLLGGRAPRSCPISVTLFQWEGSHHCSMHLPFHSGQYRLERVHAALSLVVLTALTFYCRHPFSWKTKSGMHEVWNPHIRSKTLLWLSKKGSSAHAKEQLLLCSTHLHLLVSMFKVFGRPHLCFMLGAIF